MPGPGLLAPLPVFGQYVGTALGAPSHVPDFLLTSGRFKGIVKRFVQGPSVEGGDRPKKWRAKE